jgi:hypothetical protein
MSEESSDGGGADAPTIATHLPSLAFSEEPLGTGTSGR